VIQFSFIIIIFSVSVKLQCFALRTYISIIQSSMKLLCGILRDQTQSFRYSYGSDESLKLLHVSSFVFRHWLYWVWFCLGLCAGWSIDCLQDWGSYMKLAIPSVFMVWFEWWIWEVGGFLAGQYCLQHTVMLPSFQRTSFSWRLALTITTTSLLQTSNLILQNSP